jgi:DNA repair protein SbcC/Rad50
VIPQRVMLSGFLCYKEEQSIEFDGNATLWMLSGLNGSGKSAIFDALTYALFGHHRGGGTGAVELINKDSDTLVVAFDFLFEDIVYRARRTLKRDTRGGARGTQQIFRHEPTKGKAAWLPIEETSQKREFDAWIASTIGLNYDTFTSSVLLLQGKAEKLLDSRPEGRREVLASIVDLGRYERLHRFADDSRKALDAELKVLNGRLGATRDITPIELEEAKGKIAQAEEAREATRAEVERLKEMEYLARQWADLQSRLASARNRYRRAEGVLAEASSIESAYARLTELRTVVPPLHEITVAKAKIHESEQNTKALQDQREKLLTQLATRDSALKQIRERKATLDSVIIGEDADLRAVSAKLQVCAGQLERLKECERQEADLERLRADLARLPVDAGTLLRAAQERHQQLEALSRLVPLLTRLHTRRESLRAARELETKASAAQVEVRARGETCKSDADTLRKQLDGLIPKTKQARELAAEARTLFNQARQSLDELAQLDSATRCRHCGQPLTAGHIREEKVRRTREVNETRTRHEKAQHEQQEADGREADLQTRLTAADEAYQKARDEYRDAVREIRSAQEATARLNDECRQAHAELPEEYRLRVCRTTPTDWLTPTYPTATDVAALQNEARGVDTTRKALREAEQTHQEWSSLRARETTTQETLSRLVRELPVNRDGVRQEFAHLQSRQEALHRTIDANRTERQKAERESDNLTRERDRDQTALGRLDTSITEQRLVRETAQRTIVSQTRNLPESWHGVAERITLRELSELSGEQQRLQESGADDRAKELQQARLNLDLLREEQKKLEAEERKVPADARLEQAALTVRLDEAKQRDEQCEETLREARESRAVMEEYVKQRRQLQEEIRTQEAEWRSSELLAELLGRNRLQLYLVRQAERQVVEYANAVLDRLSGGQLYLRLSGEANGEGSSAKALELEAYNRGTGEKPINVAFLSGSQKFRVAVSLALGIGQYASRQHRPIESVIIDEGFGCLDSQGRQVMVQELQNLRSQMRCVLLVSHQEDFAEAFNDGYHFELENGATRVKRFHK